MKMIAWFLAPILWATLTLADNQWFEPQDIASRIRIAHCRSICLMNHAINGVKCTTNIIKENQCRLCWEKCSTLGTIQEETRHVICQFSSGKDVLKQAQVNNFINRSGYRTACLFYETRGAEKDKYEPSKLPAPETHKAFHMERHDVAVIMHRSYDGRWLEHDYFSGNEISVLAVSPGAWIIVAREDGTLRHYSWEIWKPKLESLEEGYPLYQAHITWKDWYVQLEQQLVEFQKANPKLKIGSYDWTKKPSSSFVVTWQYETGDYGIMGNQVTSSESANISLPSDSRYLVRITTNDSPGSYPIVVNTRTRKILFPWKSNKQFRWLMYVLFPAIIVSICLLVYLFYQFKKSSSIQKKLTILEEGNLTTTQKKPTKKSVDEKQRDSCIYQVYLSR